MHYRAIKVKFSKGVTIEATYQDGKVVRYDLSKLFNDYPQYKKLLDSDFFMSGRLDPGGYGLIWNDEIDCDLTSVYLEGEAVGEAKTTFNQQIGFLVSKTREEKNITQVELARLSHIDQGDISKIEKGVGNPTLSKINKIFNALGKTVKLTLL